MGQFILIVVILQLAWLCESIECLMVYAVIIFVVVNLGRDGDGGILVSSYVSQEIPQVILQGIQSVAKFDEVKPLYAVHQTDRSKNP